MTKLPPYHAYMNPLLAALRQLGGSGSTAEIYEKLVEIEKLPESFLEAPYKPDRSNQTEIIYRLAWAQTYLKKFGLLENSSRGVWSLTSKAREIDRVDPQEVVRLVRNLDREHGHARKKAEVDEPGPVELANDAQDWKSRLHHILTMDMDPAAFERLTQRVLRESGFVSVEVTGRTGDGGIDGKGIARIHGFMSFHVIFQCKKFKGSVSAGMIRDFRGAMVGRADKGLFITTGTFTPAAIKEATRDGAPPIDLVDGDQLADKLKELGLGVKREMVEKVTIDDEWFVKL